MTLETGQTKPDCTRGLTMIELVVAMSVFALVAVLGLQSLTGMLRQRDRAAAFAEASAGLGRVSSLLRHDLASMVPVSFYRPDGSVASAVDSDAQGQWFAMSVTNAHPYAPMGKSGLIERVEYRVAPETGEMFRSVWRTVWPVSAEQKGPDMLIAEGVTGLRVRSFWTGIGWVEGVRFEALEQAPRGGQETGQDDAGVAPESYSDLLPAAVEITLSMRGLGDIRLMETLQ